MGRGWQETIGGRQQGWGWWAYMAAPLDGLSGWKPREDSAQLSDSLCFGGL